MRRNLRQVSTPFRDTRLKALRLLPVRSLPLPLFKQFCEGVVLLTKGFEAQLERRSGDRAFEDQEIVRHATDLLFDLGQPRFDGFNLARRGIGLLDHAQSFRDDFGMIERVDDSLPEPGVELVGGVTPRGAPHLSRFGGLHTYDVWSSRLL